METVIALVEDVSFAKTQTGKSYKRLTLSTGMKLNYFGKEYVEKGKTYRFELEQNGQYKNIKELAPADDDGGVQGSEPRFHEEPPPTVDDPLENVAYTNDERLRVRTAALAAVMELVSTRQLPFNTSDAGRAKFTNEFRRFCNLILTGAF